MKLALKSAGKKLSFMKGKTLAILSAHSPEILTGVGVAGLIGTVILTAKAAVKIDHILTEKEAEKGEKLTTKEIVQATWKEATPVILSTAATGACIIASHQISSNRRAALMAAYAMAEDKLQTYKEKVTDILDGDQEVQHEVATDYANRPSTDHIFETGKGTTLCMDIVSGRLFRSSMESVRRAQNDVNEMIISDWSATLNDFYDALGLDRIKESVGGELGWNSNNLLRIRFDTVLSKEGDAVLVVDYDVYPEYRLI